MAKREKRHAGYGPPCPANEEHGPLIDIGVNKWLCPHAEHVAKGEGSKYVFTDTEAFRD